MKIQNSCIECIIKQARVVAELCTDDSELVKEILRETMRKLAEKPLDHSPAFHTNVPYHTAMELSGVSDPYREEKKKQNDLVFEMIDELKLLINNSQAPLKTAAKLAVAGNVIDLGIVDNFNIRDEIKKVLKEDFARNNSDSFLKDLSSAKVLLYLCDNAGEIIFDGLFLETINSFYPDLLKYAVVKSGPIINDAMLQDATRAGLQKFSNVIECGGPFCGTPFSLVTREVQDLLRSADIVISKGQGNFETLSGLPRPIYFMLKAKCKNVADELSVNFGDVVFIKHTGTSSWK